jgi:hypothetical protein
MSGRRPRMLERAIAHMRAHPDRETWNLEALRLAAGVQPRSAYRLWGDLVGDDRVDTASVYRMSLTPVRCNEEDKRAGKSDFVMCLTCGLGPCRKATTLEESKP